MKVRYDLSRVSRELLEKYVDMMLCVTRNNAAGSRIDANSYLGREIVKAAEVPLRTKAEVDADIVKAVRDYVSVYNSLGSDMNLMDFKFKGCFDHPSDQTLPEVLRMLLAEETSD